MKTRALLLSAVWGLQAAPIEFRGTPSELVVSQVSDRAVRVQILPVSDGKTQAAKSTTALLPLTTKELFRGRDVFAQQSLPAGNLRVTIHAEPLRVSLLRENKVVQELAIGKTNVAFRIGGPVFGLGEGAQQFDRRGALYTMEPSWGGWNRPILGSVVPSPYLIGAEGWAIFAAWPEVQFDLRDYTVGRVFARTNSPNDDGLDLFLVEVREPADALTEYNRLTGKPVIPPKWALGYMQSHRTLADPSEALRVAKTFREKQLPVDAVIYLGTGYCTNGWNTGHGSLQFNPNAFDKPAESIKALHDLNLKVVLHINRAPRNLFGLSISESSDDRLHIKNYWTRHRDTFALGVDGWWPDDGDELPLEARLTRHRTYYEGPLVDRPNERPWSLHRTGYAGSQRYGGWIWSGDIDGRWATLAAQVSVGLNHGLSLTPFWGSDTGGFYPERDLTGELYARWFQFSTFCPSFRSHGRTWHLRLPWGWNTGKIGPIEHPDRTDRAELNNPAIEPICKKYLELRYQLLPYNYTVARQAVDTGLPMMRAMWLHYPKDAEAVKTGSQYLWGRDLLIAPVVEKGATTKRVYLPEGRWVDYWTNEKQEGKRWVERPVDLGTMPIYARAGTILPVDPIRQYTAQPVSEPTTIKVFPGADGSFTLYDDDGKTLAYQKTDDAAATWIQMTWQDSARKLKVQLDPRMKKLSEPRRFKLEVTDKPDTKTVEFTGAPVEFSL